MVNRPWRDRHGAVSHDGKKEVSTVEAAEAEDSERKTNGDLQSLAVVVEQPVMSSEEQLLLAPVEQKLALAWWARRRSDWLQQQRLQLQAVCLARQAAGLEPPPVDVDSMSAWVEDSNNNVPLDTKRSSGHTAEPFCARYHASNNNIHQRPPRDKERDDATHSSNNTSINNTNNTSSMASVALSECTPVISNRHAWLTPPPPPPYRHTKHLAAAPDTDTPSPSSQDDTTANTVNDKVPRQPKIYCFGVWNRFRNRQGKRLYLLLLFLILCLVVLATIAVVYKTKTGKKGPSSSAIHSSNDSNSGGGVGGGKQSNLPTFPPTAGVVVVGVPPTPTALKSTSTLRPTLFVSTTAPKVRTPSPSVAPSTPPTIVVPQSVAPQSLALLTSSLRPSRNPVTLRPSTAPTTSHPTTAPTAGPSLSLNGLAASLWTTDTLNGTQMGDNFGSALALSRSGNVLAVGAPLATNANSMVRAGRVQVYESLDNGQWQKRGSPIEGRTAQDGTGTAVALNDDGSVLALSEFPQQNSTASTTTTTGTQPQATGNVRVYFYNPTSGNYDVLMGQELRSDFGMSNFGNTLALSGHNKLAVGAPLFSSSSLIGFQVGRVCVYEYASATNEWILLGQPLSGTAQQDWFGSAVALYEDSFSLLVVASAPRNFQTGGYVGAYQWDSSSQEWRQLGGKEMTNNAVSAAFSASTDNEYGHVLSLSKTSSSTFRLAIGIPFKNDPNTGSKNVGMTVVYEYNTTDTAWAVVGEPITSHSVGDGVGYSVKLLDEGNLLIIGAPGSVGSSGSVKILRYDWSLNSFTTTGTTMMGSGVHGEEFGAAVDATRRSNDNRLVLTVGALLKSETQPGYVAILEEQ